MLLRRGEDGYEEARRAAVWNAKKPDRYPAAIMLARTDADVVRGVRLAREHGWKVAIRSGGHSWSANHLRDGGLLLDLSALDAFEINSATGTASAGPATRGQVFQRALNERGFYFPTGTCPTVALGGYTLGGGASFTGRSDGPACYSLEAIDVVTAAGELIHADDQSHPEIVWAARGAGPGFFGAVTRMHLKIKPLHRSMLWSLYVFPIDLADEFLAWFIETLPRTSPMVANNWMAVESFLPHHQGTIFALFPVAFGDNEEETRAALEIFEQCPFLDRAIVHQEPGPWTYDDGYGLVGMMYAEGNRYRSDTLWVTPDAPGFLEPMKEILQGLPTRGSHVLWAPWNESQHPNAAYSLGSPLAVHVYGVGSDAGQDAALDAWVTQSMKSIQPFSLGGGKVNDCDLASYPKNVLSPASADRLEELRARHDPDGVFHTYWGTPRIAALD
jgi:FAD/FMN-containing dehydrogenase